MNKMASDQTSESVEREGREEGKESCLSSRFDFPEWEIKFSRRNCRGRHQFDHSILPPTSPDFL